MQDLLKCTPEDNPEKKELEKVLEVVEKSESAYPRVKAPKGDY